MSLVAWLLDNRDKTELAKELARLAHENATLKNKVFALEHEVFWMKSVERNKDANHPKPDPASDVRSGR